MTDAKTAGQIALELAQKTPDTTRVIEIVQESFEDYEKKLVDTIEKARLKYPADFFIVVLSKLERALSLDGRPFIRRLIADTAVCPSPFYDQVVYKYHRNAEDLQFLWSIPDPETCSYLENHSSMIPKEEYQLLDFVQRYHNGSLLNWAKRLNNEDPDAPSIILERI
jgi:hypothetical protein